MQNGVIRSFLGQKRLSRKAKKSIHCVCFVFNLYFNLMMIPMAIAAVVVRRGSEAVQAPVNPMNQTDRRTQRVNSIIKS